MTDNHRTIVRVGDDWVEVRPGQVWAERKKDGSIEQFKVFSVSSDRAKVLWNKYRVRQSKRLSAFRSCELIQDAEEEEK